MIEEADVQRREQFRAMCRYCRWYGPWSIYEAQARNQKNDHDEAHHPRSGSSEGGINA